MHSVRLSILQGLTLSSLLFYGSAITHGEESPAANAKTSPAQTQAPSNDPSFDELIRSFETSGDLELLRRIEALLRERKSPPEEVVTVSLRVLAAIPARREQLTEASKPSLERMRAFEAEMKKRTDQPFINPGSTKPEDIPDQAYREHYVQYLADLSQAARRPEPFGALRALETTFRSLAEIRLTQMPRSRQKLLLVHAEVQRFSPEVRQTLENSLHLTLETLKGGQVFRVGHTRDELKEMALETSMHFGTAHGFACKYVPRETFMVLVRANRCYVINDSHHMNAVEALPIHAGDQFFEFLGLDDLKTLGLPILSGAEAAAELLRQDQEATSTGKAAKD